MSGRTVRRWATAGILPAVQIGGLRRYPAERLDQLIAPITSEAPAGNQGFAKTAGKAAGDALEG